MPCGPLPFVARGGRRFRRRGKVAVQRDALVLTAGERKRREAYLRERGVSVDKAGAAAGEPRGGAAMATLEQSALTFRHMTRMDIDAVLSLDRKFGKRTGASATRT